jgi:hypothetical protein
MVVDIEEERESLEEQSQALFERRRKLERAHPTINPALAVTYVGLLIVQGGHELEHCVQVVQRYVLNIPDGNGILGQYFQIDPMHFAFNLAYFWLVLLVYRHSGATRPAQWTRGMTTWWLLTFALALQSYHLLEHCVKMYQYIDTGRNGTPGILGNVFDLVWLHWFFNTATYVPLVVVFFVGGFNRELKANLREAWSILSGQLESVAPRPSAPTFSRRSFMVGTLGVVAGVGLARVAMMIRAPTLVVPLFKDMTKAAGIAFRHKALTAADAIQAGVAFFDFDNDGRLDLYLTNADGPNALYRNNGNGTFTELAAKAGLADVDGVSVGVACADYDNDGFCDLIVTRLGGLRLYHNNGNGTFADVTETALPAPTGGHPSSAAWGDFDGDGFLDLYVTYWLDSVPDPVSDLQQSDTELRAEYTSRTRSHRLLKNNGDGTFRDVGDYLGTNREPSPGLAVGFFDYNNDNRPDLYVVNDLGKFVTSNALYRNDGKAPGGWRFSDVSSAAGVDKSMFGMGLAVGDYDGDGRLDMYVTNMGDNVLYHNRGDGTFEETTNRAGVGRGIIRGEDSVGWGTAFLDFDNDGWLDLYFVAGVIYPIKNSRGEYSPDQPNALFKNNGDGTFRDVSKLSATNKTSGARGLAIGDYDGDGFLDLLIANYDQPPSLLKNPGNGNHWLMVRLVGTKSNRCGIGAHVSIAAGGKRQLREICSGTSFLSSHGLDAHFGLGQLNRVDELQIRWPSGIVQTLRDVGVNQVITVTEPAGG